VDWFGVPVEEGGEEGSHSWKQGSTSGWTSPWFSPPPPTRPTKELQLQAWGLLTVPAPSGLGYGSRGGPYGLGAPSPPQMHWEGRVELQVWCALGLAELLRKQVNGAGERALGKGDKSIRKPIFIGSLMILQEKPDEGGGEAGGRRTFITGLGGRQVLLCILGGQKVM